MLFPGHFSRSAVSLRIRRCAFDVSVVKVAAGRGGGKRKGRDLAPFPVPNELSAKLGRVQPSRRDFKCSTG
jgi:hypothetical protein